MLTKILEYQKLDIQLNELKKQFDNNPAKVLANKMLALAKEAQSKLIELEKQAKAALTSYEKSKKDFDTCFNQLSKLVATENVDENILKQNIEKTTALNLQLNTLERTVSAQADAFGNILKDFETYKNNLVTYKQKYVDAKKNVDDEEQKLVPQLEEIKSSLAKLEKQIEPHILSKYKHLKQDKIFPVFVPLVNNSCGGCRMSVPAALMDRLKANGYLECEQCRRYIYI